jgi:hypothetical protein
MRGIGFRLVAVALGVALVAGLAGVAATAPDARAAGPTQRTVYSPFAAGGALRRGLRAIDRAGTCFTSSSVIGRRGVYRCITGDRLRDPCYADAVMTARRAAPVVVCAATPWTATLVRITLTAALPRDPPVRVAGRPWGLELAGGARCVFVTGASQLVRGYRLNYVCPNGRFLYGSARTATATWRIREARSASSKTLRFVAIGHAWT